MTSRVGEVTAVVVETARESELEAEPENGIEWLQSPDKIWNDKELLLVDEERKWFLDMETAPGEDAVKILEMMTKDLGEYVHLVDKAAAELETNDSNFERSSTVGEILSNCTTCYRVIVLERKSQLRWKTSLVF